MSSYIFVGTYTTRARAASRCQALIMEGKTAKIVKDSENQFKVYYRKESK